MRRSLARFNSARVILPATEGRMTWHAQHGLIRFVRKRGQARTQLAFCAAFLSFPLVAGLAAVVLSLTTDLGVSWPILVLIVLVHTVVSNLIALRYCVVREMRDASRSLYEVGVRPRSCLRCGYDLRGSDAERCPECGERLAAVTARDDA